MDVVGEPAARLVVGDRAGLAVAGRTYAWIGLERRTDGIQLVCSAADEGSSDERDLVATHDVPADADVELTIEGGVDSHCRFTASIGTATGQPVVVAEFEATGGQWAGATIGLFAAGDPHSAPGGHGCFGPVHPADGLRRRIAAVVADGTLTVDAAAVLADAVTDMDPHSRNRHLRG